jgi:hypothetical protein
MNFTNLVQELHKPRATTSLGAATTSLGAATTSLGAATTSLGAARLSVILHEL